MISFHDWPHMSLVVTENPVLEIDVVGYSALGQNLDVSDQVGDGIRKLLVRPGELLQAGLDVVKGLVRHKTGNGYFVVLDGVNAEEALEFGRQFLEELDVLNHEGAVGNPLQLRMVLGFAAVGDDGDASLGVSLDTALGDAKRLIGDEDFGVYRLVTGRDAALFVTNLFYSRMQEDIDRSDEYSELRGWKFQAWALEGKRGDGDIGFLCGDFEQIGFADLEVAQILLDKGVALSEAGHAEEAIAAFDEVLKRYGDREEASIIERVVKALANKGVTLDESGDTAGAIATLEEVVKRHGDREEASIPEQIARVLAYKGIILGKSGDMAGAVVTYDEVLKRYGDREEASIVEQVVIALVNKGLALGKSDDTSGAIATFDEALKRYGDREEASIVQFAIMALVSKGTALGRSDDTSGAIATFDEALKRYGNREEAFVVQHVVRALANKGVLLAQSGDIAGSIPIFENTIKRFGDRPEPDITEILEPIINLLNDLRESSKEITKPKAHKKPPKKLPKLITAETLDHHQQENSTHLPYALKQLHIKNFQCIKDTKTHAPLPIDAPFLFLTGENGDGKSAFLQALLYPLFKIPEPTVSAQTQIEIEIKINNQNQILRFPTDTPPDDKNIVAYGPIRLEIQNDLTKSETLSPFHSLLHQRGALLNIERWLKDQKLIALSVKKTKKQTEAAEHRIKNTIDLLTELMPNVDNIQFDDNIRYVEKGLPVPFEHLASGHKSIIAMIGDLVIRLYTNQPNANSIADLKGLVLLDELENHLHPKWQRKLPGLLARTLPRVQFIVSTHSAFPILGAPPGSIFLRVERDQNGSRLEQLEIDIANQLPNGVFTSPLFGLDHIRSIQNTDSEKIRTFDYPRQKKQDERRKKLRSSEARGIFSDESDEQQETDET